jgi:hypothetical protein
MRDETGKEEKWEFGSLEWCRFAVATGIRLIEAANLDLKAYEWGFSEEYARIPERLLGGRDRAVWHFMVHDGKVSGGASLPDECLALPGFHIVADWPLMAHASSFIYDQEGQQRRFADEAVLRAGLEAAGKGSKADPVRGKAVWPPAIAAALIGTNNESLHNITARRLLHSPELKDLPQTAFGVPILTKMTDEEKAHFYRLLGR